MANSILPPARRAGVCLHLASLPGTCGIGDIGRSAMQFIDALKSMHLGIWQFLPAGPTGFGDSPYQSLSTFAGNEMLIDVQELVDLNLLRPGDLDTLKALPHQAVDYGRLIPLKNSLLEAAAGRFETRADATTRTEFEAFVAEHDAAWLHDYALFRVLKHRYRDQPWTAWDKSFATRQQSVLQGLALDARTEIATVKILQFLVHRQFRRLHAYAAENGVHLFGDVPIYIATDSVDAWASPENFRIDPFGHPDRVAGVPPDYFSADGQLWGNPLHDWKQQEKSGFDWWRGRLSHALSLVDFVRLDHFRGFEAFWSIPFDAATAKEGRWERGPGADLFETLHKSMGRLPLVAEDLGEITPAVHALRESFGFPGMRVLQFEVPREHFNLADIAENCVCYTATHDNDTTVGWFRSSSEKSHADAMCILRNSAGRPDTIHLDLLKLALRSEARWAIAPLQDFLGLDSTARLNTPGTTGGNWRWRLSWDQLTVDTRDAIGELVVASGR